jgi:DNA-binding winged helix-turn-helix (wHTH) protein/tetratricopeptide (TPR) repeat protein
LAAELAKVLPESLRFSYNFAAVAIQATNHPAYRFGPFLLDPGQRIVLRGEAIVPLAPKAICLLLLLVENAGQVVDKDTIFATVWPGTFVVESSLTKNISLLRKMLSEAGETGPVIQTVSKRGYRFVAHVRHEPLPSALSIDRPILARKTAARDFSRRFVAPVIVAGLVLLAALALGPHAGPRSPAMIESEREYLIARHIWSRLERAEVEKAVGHFERAAQLDPRSAAAYAGIAEARATMTTIGAGDPEVNLVKAREAATRALELNPNTALPYVSLGAVRLLADFDFPGAERAYARALELDPDLVAAQFRYACFLAHSGRLTDARALIQRALRREPVSSLLAFQAAKIDYFDRRYAEAVTGLRELLEREPSFSHAHYYLAMSLGQLGRTAEALDHLRQSHVHPSLLETDEAWLRSVDGDREPARALVALRRDLVREGRAKATVLLLPALDSGDADTAISSLNEMWRTREVELLALKVDPRLDALRGDARFRSLIRRIWAG